MRKPEEIKERIKTLKQDKHLASIRKMKADMDNRFANAAMEATAVACAWMGIKTLEWVLEGASPAPADGCDCYQKAMDEYRKHKNSAPHDALAGMDYIIDAIMKPLPSTPEGEACWRCNGKKEVPLDSVDEMAYGSFKDIECPECQGTGLAGEVTG